MYVPLRPFGLASDLDVPVYTSRYRYSDRLMELQLLTSPLPRFELGREIRKRE
jgi:hypothetical protein